MRSEFDRLFCFDDQMQSCKSVHRHNWIVLLAKQGSQITFFVPGIKMRVRFEITNLASAGLRFCPRVVQLVQRTILIFIFSVLFSHEKHENQSAVDFCTIHTWIHIHKAHSLKIKPKSFMFFFLVSVQPFAVGPFDKHCYFHSLRFNVMIAIRTVYRYWFIGISYFESPRPIWTQHRRIEPNWNGRVGCGKMKNIAIFLSLSHHFSFSLWLFCFIGWRQIFCRSKMQCDILFSLRSTFYCTYLPTGEEQMHRLQWWLHNNRNDNIVSNDIACCIYVINKISSQSRTHSFCGCSAGIFYLSLRISN